MKIKIETEDELEQLAKELLFILANLRYWTKLWSEHFGAHYKNEKIKWEQRADDCLEKLKMKKVLFQGQVEITQINANEQPKI